METVAIVGVGLIGGSFALALRKAGFTGRIIGVSSAPAIEAARRASVIDASAALEEAAQGADLVYLAQPISRILETLSQLDRWVRPGTLISDAGSTKLAIATRALETIRCGVFLGGHPMAGKETRGVESAEADLFRDKTYVLTPRAAADLELPVVRNFLEWLRRIGARIVVTSAEEHDRVVAYTSHLPQLASTALASCIAAAHGGEPPAIWGPALVENTRIALSPFEIWRDILRTNERQVSLALTSYIAELEELRNQLGTDDIGASFDRGAALAKSLREPG